MGGAASFCPLEAKAGRPHVADMKKTSLYCALFALLPATAFAEIIVDDPYFRTSRPGAPAGAAFMTLTNTGDADVQLVGAASDAAPSVMLHTHIDDGNGIMKMRHVEGGFTIPAGGTLEMKRGGDHVMFMGLSEAWEDGESLSVTLTFEDAPDLTFDIPVDNKRMDHGH